MEVSFRSSKKENEGPGPTMQTMPHGELRGPSNGASNAAPPHIKGEMWGRDVGHPSFSQTSQGVRETWEFPQIFTPDFALRARLPRVLRS